MSLRPFVRYQHHQYLYQLSICLLVSISGHPWLVFCSKTAAGVEPLVPPGQLQRVAREWDPISKQVTLGLIDCKGELPSKKSVLQRFDLDHLSNAIQSGTGFYVHSRLNPIPIPSDFLKGTTSKAAAQLLSHVVKETQPRYHRPRLHNELMQHCYHKGACALILNKGDDVAGAAKKAVWSATRKYRAVSMVVLNIDRYSLDFPEPLTALVEDMLPQGVDTEAESQWPRVLGIRHWVNPVPQSLRADPKKEEIRVRRMRGVLENEQVLDDFLNETFGDAKNGLLSEAEATKLVSEKEGKEGDSSKIAMATVQTEVPKLVDRHALAQERFQKRKEAAERAKQLREQGKRDAENHEKLSQAPQVIEEVVEGGQGKEAPRVIEDEEEVVVV